MSGKLKKKELRILFFFCDERYFPRHKCKAQVYQLEIMEEEGREIIGNEEELLEEPRVEVHVKEKPHISIHAL